MRGAFGVATFAGAACDSSAIVPLEPGAASVTGTGTGTAEQAAFHIVESSTTSLYPISAGRSIAVDIRHRTVECVGAQGETCWSIADGTFAGPVLALEWQNSIAVVDRGGSVILLTEEGQVAGRLPADAQLSSPAGAAVLPDGRLAVSDTLGHRVVAFDAAGVMTTIFEDPDGQGTVLNTPRGLAVDADGNLHIVSGGNARIEVVTAAGRWVRSYGGIASGLASPRGIAIDEAGRALVADPVAGALFAFQDGVVLERHVVTREDGFAAAPSDVTVLADGSVRIALANV
ncbi:MAG: sugar lactone lactonase YvrE [Bradymonadia bacterium]|jgi:sugar lactone lactonase YvrE